MPEVIVIDEIGTELEALAARTIAERGVMLVATAHGNELANLIRNPTLCDLVGGIQSVTLGDEEARRRRTQKTVLERAAEPTFPLAVEMHSRHRWLVHREVALTVDLLLRGQAGRPQVRELGPAGQVQLAEAGPPGALAERPAAAFRGASGPRRLAPVPLPDPLAPSPHAPPAEPRHPPESAAARPTPLPPLRLCGVGLAARQLEEAVRSRPWPVQVVSEPEQADALLSLRGQLGRDPQLRSRARGAGLPILVIKSDNLHQLQRAIERLLERRTEAATRAAPEGGGSADPDDAHAAMEECRLAVEKVVLPQGRPVELLPRSERVRTMQAELVTRYRLRSAVFGRGPQLRLRVFPA